jgi:hypothetical protein
MQCVPVLDEYLIFAKITTPVTPGWLKSPDDINKKAPNEVSGFF